MSLAGAAAGGLAVALVVEFAAAWVVAAGVLLALVVIAVAWVHAGRTSPSNEPTDHHHVRVVRQPPYDWEQDR
ncbi:MAG: hypothetical protein ACP5QO_16945 [Clostridia bacterium]